MDESEHIQTAEGRQFEGDLLTGRVELQTSEEVISQKDFIICLQFGTSIPMSYFQHAVDCNFLLVGSKLQGKLF
jgi:hypothetical protein